MYIRCDKPILIIGNSPDLINCKYGDIIEKNFYVVRFSPKGKSLEYDKNLLNECIGQKIDLWWKKRYIYKLHLDENDKNFQFDYKYKNLFSKTCKVTDNYIEIDTAKLRKNYSRIYDRNMTRGLESILMFLYYNNIRKQPIYIHGFSHEITNLFTKSDLDPNVKDYKTGSHNYNLEEQIVDYFTKEGKIIQLSNSEFTKSFSEIEK